MSERIRSLFTYIVVFFILLFALAVISPAQFETFVNLFSESTELILVLIAIAIIAYILRKTKEI